VAQQSLVTRHVREVTLNGEAKPLGSLDANQIMQLDIVLPLSDQAGLHTFLNELYDPASSSYRHFLTVAEFTERFGPSQADYDAVVGFARMNGLTVVGGTRDGMDVQVKGPVSAIQAAFHVEMRTFQHPTEDRAFFAPDREPTVNLPLQLWHISGLDNYSIPHTMLVNKDDYAAAHGIAPENVVSHASTGSGPSASFLGSDMRAAYYGGTALTGAGQNLGLFEYLGTDPTDLITYYKNAGETINVPITLLSTDGTSLSCLESKDCDDTEQTLDMTQALGMAPGLSSLTMYVGSTDTAILSVMTTYSPLPTTIGCSWGWTPVDPTTLDPYFERMAAQGQNFFAASGDHSTWSSKNEAWPADDPNVVSVGGTDLVTAGAGGAWENETAWADSGGGISPDSIAIPAWQQIPGVINSSNHGSTTLRNGPDVSANANFTFYVCADQTACTANHWGGTSFAAPMWAGYMALVNQQLVSNSEPPIGFLNPTIYAQNVTSAYDADFHDITSGTSGSYSAVTGYDLVTGWGSPNGQNLINALAPPVPAFLLSASPTSLNFTQGESGTTAITVNGENGFTGSVSLAASGLPIGVTASFFPNPTTGTSVLTLSANSLATTGTATVTITGTSGTAIATTTIVLTVNPGASFSLGASPSSLGVVQGGSGTSAIMVTGENSFAGTVALAASGLPSGVTATFSPNPTAGSSVLTLTASSSATTGTATVTITGTSGILAQTTAVALTINPLAVNGPGLSNFGAVNIGTTSPVIPLVFTVVNGGTLGSTTVLTQGATGLDFADAGADTCTTTIVYAAGQTCSVNVTFTPMVAGTRYGAVVLNDNNGNVLATGYLQGTGAGPQLTFFPGTQTTLGNSFNFASGASVDGSGNVYVVDTINNIGNVQEIMSVNGSIPVNPTIKTLVGGLECPVGPALDAAGNVYYADVCYHTVNQIQAVNGSIPASPIVRTLTSQFVSPAGIAIDGSGNVYVLDASNNTVSEILAVNGTIPVSPAIVTLASGFKEVDGIAVDSNGNIYVSDDTSREVFEVNAVNGSIPASPHITTLGSGFVYPRGIAVDGAGDVYVADYFQNAVFEILAVNGSIPASPTIQTLGTGLVYASGLAVDENRNVFVADYGDSRVVNLNYSNPPSLTFASTAVGATSTDSPQTVTVENVGNAALSFPIPASGNNPGIATNFTLNSGGASACPLVNGDSSLAGTLAAGASCQLPISFTPTAAGTLSGSLVLTDNNLNAAAPGYTSQSIALSGTASQGTPTITWAVPAAIIYGTALSATQLNASSTIAGTFTYSPAAGTVLTAGTQTLTVTFAPTDTADYTTATATVTITVDQATPAVTWPNPVGIAYGTALSSTQLNATSTIAGTFSYSPSSGAVLTAGSQTLTTTFTPTDTVDYTSATATVLLTVNKATPTITWAAPGSIIYGTALSSTQLNATSTIAGTFTYLPANGTVLGAGQQTLTASFTPTDTTDYTTGTASVTLTVNKATPSIGWATPAAVTYGTALSAAQLNAASTVAGTFTYSPAAGTVLNAGTQTLMVSFTPTDLTDYAPTTATVSLIVNKAALTISWLAPAAISYGTALSGTQLDATSTAAGTFAYSPAAGTVLSVGNHTLTATFTPTNAANYTSSTATASVTLTVNKATPTITWATPKAIPFGTALSATQLNATSTAAGTFAYSPAAGTVLSVGQQTLTVTFTPTNTTDYTTAAASTTLTVNKATPTITWATPKAITYGTALSATQLDATSTVAGTFTYSPAAGTVLSAGQQTLTVTFNPTNTTDYATATASITLTVNKATPAITWPTPAPISYGTVLSATQLDATSEVSGTFVYSPASGTLSVGMHTLSTTLTPGDTVDYNTAKASVSLTVNQAAQTITFTPPVSPVVYGVSPIKLVATSTSGLAVSYSVQSGPGKVSGTTLTITGAGTVVVTANQAGNSSFTAAPTVTQSIVVNQATPSITLKSSANPVAAGKPITFTATLAGVGSAKPTGTVTFLDGSTAIGAGTLNSSGVATFATSGLAAGSHSITASYSGDNNYEAETSSAVDEIVN
jgi:kumamolisin